MYAGGDSLKTIARRLNAEGVESPMPQRGRRSRSWCPSAIRTILHNVRYTGKVVWSRKHKIRDPKTGRRVFRSKEGELPVEGADCRTSELFRMNCGPLSRRAANSSAIRTTTRASVRV